MSESNSYHAVFAIGHFARLLQAQTAGRRGSFHALAVLQMLWLRTDPLDDAPTVQVELDDLAGIVSGAERLRQVIAALVIVGAVERVDNTTSRQLRLVKPCVDDLDDVARGQIENAAARAAHARLDLERAQRLSGLDAAPGSAHVSKADRSNVLTRLHKKPSDVRDVLAAMAGVSPASLRYSGPGSGAVQAAVAWLAETGATWDGLVLLCETVRADAGRPKQDLVWLFGEQHQVYRDGVVSSLRAPASGNTSASDPPKRDKKLGEIDRADVERWLLRQVKDELAIGEVWAHEIASANLLYLTGPEATQRIQAWHADPSRSLVEHFA